MEIINLGEADGLPPVDWAIVTDKLDAGSAPAPDSMNSRTTWLSTVNEDGSPHVTPVGALWLDGTFWFQTGAGTRKGRNVARDPRCSIAVSIRDADVVFEGDTTRVTEAGALARVAKGWADNGWPAEPDASGQGITAPFNAPAQGPPPWKPFDPEWMEATFERFWDYAQYVVKITTALLAPPPPHVQEVLGAGQTNEKVAKAFANGLNHPPLFEEWIYDPEKARAFIAS